MGWIRFKIALFVLAFLLAAGVTGWLLFHHRNQYHGPGHFAKAAWAPVGAADPVSALRTGLWAMQAGDGKVMFDSLTPDVQAYVRTALGKKADAKGMSVEDLLAQKSGGVSEQIIGFRVLDEQMDDHKATIKIYVQGWWHKATIHLRKIGNDWRLAGVDWK